MQQRLGTVNFFATTTFSRRNCRNCRFAQIAHWAADQGALLGSKCRAAASSPCLFYATNVIFFSYLMSYFHIFNLSCFFAKKISYYLSSSCLIFTFSTVFQQGQKSKMDKTEGKIRVSPGQGSTLIIWHIKYPFSILFFRKVSLGGQGHQVALW